MQTKSEPLDQPFCMLPYTHVMVGMFGEYRICNAQPSNSWVIRDETGSPCSILTHDPHSALRSTNHTRLKDMFGNGIKPSECRKCVYTEQTGSVSLRQSYLNQHHYATWQRGVISLDLRLGNRCNAKCVTCGPTNSNTWYSDWANISGYQEFSADNLLHTNIFYQDGAWIDNNPGLQWSNNDECWQRLKGLATNLTEITFSGGEPLLNFKHITLLKSIISYDRASQVSLIYKTNLSRYPVEFIDVWKEFKSVKLIISMDAVEDAFEYIRYGIIWKDFVYNLNEISNVAMPNFILVIGFTASALSILEASKLHDWLSRNFPNLLDTITVNDVIDPVSVRISCLPRETLAELRQTYNQRIGNWQTEISAALGRVQHLPGYPHYLISRLEKLDRIRNTNWKRSLPSLQTSLGV
jgi:organic radical activating enzyme